MVLVPSNMPEAAKTVSAVGLSTPVPCSSNVCSPPEASKLKLMLPVRGPAATGEKATSVMQ